MTHAPRRARPSVGTCLFGLLVLATTLAGCTGGTGDTDARIEFEGSGHGTQRDTAVCDSDAELTLTSGITSGLVVFRVTDGNGTEIFMRTINGALNIEGEPLQGAEGPWEVTATRSESFDGFYKVSIDCGSDLAQNGNTTDDGDFVRAPRFQ